MWPICFLMKTVIITDLFSPESPSYAVLKGIWQAQKQMGETKRDQKDLLINIFKAMLLVLSKSSGIVKSNFKAQAQAPKLP